MQQMQIIPKIFTNAALPDAADLSLVNYIQDT